MSRHWQWNTAGGYDHDCSVSGTPQSHLPYRTL